MRTRIHTIGVRRNHPDHPGRHPEPGDQSQPVRNRRPRRGAIAAAPVGALGAALAACGHDSDSGSSNSIVSRQQQEIAKKEEPLG